MKNHTYEVKVNWTGNLGNGTSDYRAFERSHSISVTNKPVIFGSSDPAFRGDASKYNPEELLVASLSSCHMLWYLHLCAVAGVIVVDYDDNAQGVMEETSDGGGHFSNVLLRPQVVVAEPSMIEKAEKLHKEARQKCFIANSVNFEVAHEAVCRSI